MERNRTRFSTPLIVLAIPPISGHNRRILNGIAQFSTEHARWSFRFSPWAHYADPPDLSQAHGVIALVAVERVARAIAKSGLPVVNVGASEIEGLALPTIQCDHVAVGRMAAHEYVQRGFEYLGCVGESQREFVKPRLRGFNEYAEAHRRQVFRFDLPEEDLTSDTIQELGQWLRELPKPIGVFVQNDLKAQGVLDACRQFRVRVPEDVAVIGVDDDEVLCGLTAPPLSSIELDSELMGYESARLLHQMMSGDTNLGTRRMVPPVRVVTRHSSDVFAIDNKHVVDALQFIRDHADEGIDIRDVLDAVPVSRRWLEIQFTRLLGRTPAEELRRVRIDRAKLLLRNSSMSILDVSIRSGFTSQSTFAVSFKREVGCSPSTYRSDVHRKVT